MLKLACCTVCKQKPDPPLVGARVLFLKPSLAQVPAEESVAQVMGWLRRTFGRQGIDVPEPLEVLLASCFLLSSASAMAEYDEALPRTTACNGG